MSSLPVRIRLGRSGLQVSPVCYGSWQLSPRFWGPQPEDTLIASMRRAYEVGINFYDTAGAYGDGLAEQVMGKALEPLPRDKVVIATKVCHHFLPDGKRYPDLSAAYVHSYCDDALRRLRTDYIDLYQCHAFESLTRPQETVQAMEDLIRKGKIRAYGVSNWTVEQMRLGWSIGNYSTCQPPYSLLLRGIENDILPFCMSNDVGVLVYSPLHRGLLSGKYKGDETFEDHRKTHPDYQNPRFKTICDRVAQLKPIAQDYGLTISQLVLTATLALPSIHCVIVGVKQPSQIEEAAGAMGKTISRQDWDKVRSLLSVP